MIRTSLVRSHLFIMIEPKKEASDTKASPVEVKCYLQQVRGKQQDMVPDPLTQKNLCNLNIC